MTAEADVTAEGAVAAADDWRDDIAVRQLVDDELEARFVLAPGDRPLVEAGTTVKAGDPLLEHLRDRRIDEVVMPAEPGSTPTPTRSRADAGRRDRRAGSPSAAPPTRASCCRRSRGSRIGGGSSPATTATRS